MNFLNVTDGEFICIVVLWLIGLASWTATFVNMGVS